MFVNYVGRAVRFPQRDKRLELRNWQPMVLSETRGLWLSWVDRGGIGYTVRLGARLGTRSLTF